MNPGTVVEVMRMGTDRTEAVAVEVFDGQDLQGRYDRLVVLVMRMGSWLTSPQAQCLPPGDWEAQFARYREHLELLRQLGDELRPTSLRNRSEPLTGDALTGEVLELFAA